MLVFERFKLTARQKQEFIIFLSGWLEKLSVGCFVVGLFQPQHFIGGVISGVVCFAAALHLKLRSVKNDV